MQQRVAPPRRKHLVLRQRGADEHRKMREPLVAREAHDTVQARTHDRRPGRPVRLVGLKQIVAGDVGADQILHVRAPREQRAVVERHQHGALAADLQTVVEAREIFDVDGGQRDAAEAAVGPLDAARHGNDPPPARAAAHGHADVRRGAGMVAQVNEIFAVRVIDLLQDLARRGDARAVGRIERQHLELPQVRGAPHHHLVQPGKRGGAGAVVFGALDDLGEHEARLQQRIVGLPRGRERQVVARDVHLVQFERARVPAAPAVHAEQEQADEHDEQRGALADGNGHHYRPVVAGTHRRPPWGARVCRETMRGGRVMVNERKGTVGRPVVIDFECIMPGLRSRRNDFESARLCARIRPAPGNARTVALTASSEAGFADKEKGCPPLPPSS